MSREAGFIQLRRGIFEHVRDGRLTPLTFLVYIYIISQADTRDGRWKGSAGCLARELGISRRAAKYALEALQKRHYLVCFATARSRLAYVIVVHQFTATQGPQNGQRVDALHSTKDEICFFPPDEQRPEQRPDFGQTTATQGPEKGQTTAIRGEVKNLRSKKKEKRENPIAAHAIHPDLQKHVDILKLMVRDDLQSEKHRNTEQLQKLFVEGVDADLATAGMLTYKELCDLYRQTVKDVREQLCSPPSDSEVEAHLFEQLDAYIENCLYDSPTCPWISAHELNKLILFQFRYKGWNEKIYDDSMAAKLYTAIEQKYREYLKESEPDELPRCRYKIVQRPATADHVPDEQWMTQRSNLLALDLRMMN